MVPAAGCADTADAWVPFTVALGVVVELTDIFTTCELEVRNKRSRNEDLRDTLLRFRDDQECDCTAADEFASRMTYATG